jgi:hypothetical protein
MRNARWGAARSASRLLLGAALTAVLAFGAAGSASAIPVTGSTDGAATAARTDVFIRDIATDVGVEPHGTIYSSYYQSPDIKVCPTAVECASHTNPVAGTTNYVFVKLRNPGPYGSGTSLGRLHLYWTTAGGAAVWPIDWNLIGNPLVAAAAGVTTVAIPWNVPAIPYFCLLARWVSETDPMTFEGPQTVINTQFNNNIAWKNSATIFVRPGDQPPRVPFVLGNAVGVPARFDLDFRAPAGAQGLQLVAELPAVLFERWRAAGAPGEGIRIIDNNRVQILDPARARINDLLINPGERPSVNLLFSSASGIPRAIDLDVVQVGPVDDSGRKFDVGGVAYQITGARQ